MNAAVPTKEIAEFEQRVLGEPLVGAVTTGSTVKLISNG
jgi:hypothetical protein